MTHEPADIVEIERLGGLAGFGGPAGRLRSVGRLDLAQLGPTERQAVEALLSGSAAAPAAAVPDGFRYRLTRAPGSPAGTGQASVEVPESAVPDVVRDAVHDELV